MQIIREHFESLPSTNDRAKELLKTLSEGELGLVTAEVQTAGRGQYGRRWLTIKDKSLIMSFAFIEPSQDPLFYSRQVVCIVQSLLEKKGVYCTVKWPNDLMVDKKKIAGILCETTAQGLVIGVGMNVNLNEQELDGIDQPATSLFMETGSVYSIEELTETMTAHFLNSGSSLCLK